MGSSPSVPKRFIKWTPGWFPGLLCDYLHRTDRRPYNNIFDFSNFSTPYLKGVANVGALQFWWMFVALILLFAVAVRRYLMIPFGNLCGYLRICIFVLAFGFFGVMTLEIFFHISVISTMPAITIHPADNGEIVLFMKRVEAQMNSITAAVMERYHGSAVRMSSEPIYVHKVLQNILRATDDIVVTHRSPYQARPIHTPLMNLVLGCEWTHFLTFMTYWAVSLLLMATLAVTRCYLVAAAIGVILCSVGACLQTMFTVMMADTCFDPRYVLYTLKSYEFHRNEEETIQNEYVRVCTEWFAKFEVLVEHYEKNFMYAAFELQSRSLASEHDDDWRYLDETADKIFNVSRDDVAELRNILPPRCRPNFPSITEPTQPIVTTKRSLYKTTTTTAANLLVTHLTKFVYKFRDPVTPPPYYTHPLQSPRFMPPYDVVLRAICSGDRKLMLLTLQIMLLMLAQAIVIFIMIHAFFSVRPAYNIKSKLSCLQNKKRSKRSSKQKNKKQLSCRIPMSCFSHKQIQCMKSPFWYSKRCQFPRRNKSSKSGSESESKSKYSKPEISCCQKHRSRSWFRRKKACGGARCGKQQRHKDDCTQCCHSRHHLKNKSDLSLSCHLTKILNNSFFMKSNPSCTSGNSYYCTKRTSSHCNESQTCPMQVYSSCQTCWPPDMLSCSASTSTSCIYPIKTSFRTSSSFRHKPAHVSYADDVSCNSCSSCHKPINYRYKTYLAETRFKCLSSHQRNNLIPKHKYNMQLRNVKASRSRSIKPSSLPRVGLEELFDNIESPERGGKRIREIYLKFH